MPSKRKCRRSRSGFAVSKSPSVYALENPPGPGPGGAAANPWHSALLTPKPDALLEHKIMTSYEPKGAVSNHRFGPPSPTSPPRVATQDPDSAVLSANGDRKSPSNIPATGNGNGVKRKREPSISQSNVSVTQSNAATSGANERLPSVSENAFTDKPADLPSQICLCQPDPKVPRPRNAFILFRQHHQAKVVAENPGLANPEISKIIGEEWRQSPDDVKQHWKQLAEEEKIRHQRQYPDYRYQPRRGRNSVPTTIPPGQGSPRCLKCGGKSMASPPNTSPSYKNPATAAPPPPPTETPMSPYHPVGMHPRTPYGIPGGYTLNSPAPSMYAPRHAHPARMHPPHSPIAENPEAKRRRFESNGRYSHRSNGPMPAVPLTPVVPHPDYVKPASAGFHAQSAPRPHHARDNSRADNLTLAPLNIKRPGSENAQGQTKGVEAMIMSIKPISKIKTLAKISSPLPKPGPASPPQPIRGAVISVEGNDPAAMEAVGRQIREDLERGGEHRVRSWDTPRLESYDNKGAPSLYDVLQLMTHWHGISREIVKYITRAPDDEFSRASSPLSPSSKVMGLKRSHDNMEDVEVDDHDSYDGEPKIKDGNHSDTSHVHSRNDSTDTQGSSRRHGAKRPSGSIPVALLPNYQLTTTDMCASAVPIADPYSPIDHWQWVAALWRGTVGPDVIICIRGPEDVDADASPQASAFHTRTQSQQQVLEMQRQRERERDWHARHGSMNGHHQQKLQHPQLSQHGDRDSQGPPLPSSVPPHPPSSAGEMGGSHGVSSMVASPSPGRQQFKPGVEVRLEEARTVVVRCEKRGEVSEQVLRRVAFEVGEWLRGRDERERQEAGRDGSVPSSWGKR